MTLKAGAARITGHWYFPLMADFDDLTDLFCSVREDNQEWLLVLFRGIRRPIGSGVVLKVGLLGGNMLLTQNLNEFCPSSL